jgi:hypothetical protein
MNIKRDTEYKIYAFDKNQYRAVKVDDAFKYPAARMGPFITSYGRSRMLNYIMKHNLIKNVVATFTDRFTLNCEFIPPKDISKPNEYVKTFSNYHPKFEKKSSGYISFHNVIIYNHVCEHCKEEYTYKMAKFHECKEIK